MKKRTGSTGSAARFTSISQRPTAYTNSSLQNEVENLVLQQMEKAGRGRRNSGDAAAVEALNYSLDSRPPGRRECACSFFGIVQGSLVALKIDVSTSGSA